MSLHIGTAYELLLFQATNIIASKRGLLRASPNENPLLKLECLLRQIITRRPSSEASKNLGKTLPFVFETFFADCTLVAAATLYSRIRRRQFHWRSA
jgi:hypothetical protein